MIHNVKVLWNTVETVMFNGELSHMFVAYYFKYMKNDNGGCNHGDIKDCWKQQVISQTDSPRQWQCTLWSSHHKDQCAHVDQWRPHSLGNQRVPCRGRAHSEAPCWTPPGSLTNGGAHLWAKSQTMSQNICQYLCEWLILKHLTMDLKKGKIKNRYQRHVCIWLNW